MDDECIPGVVVLWTGSQPISRAFRIPAGGLVLGRDRIGAPVDERMSDEHVRIQRIDDRFVVEDLNTRNGTYAGGHSVHGRTEVQDRCVIRTGRTVSQLVCDIRPYEQAPVTRRHGIVSGAATTTLRAHLEAAALRKAHLVVAGAGGSGRRRFARCYHELLEITVDTLFEEDVSGPSADKVDARLAMLASAPSPVVMTINNVSRLHPRFEAWLRASATWIALPTLCDRLDELSVIVDDTIRARGSTLMCHSSLAEYCLITSRDIGLLVGHLEVTADIAVDRGETLIRAEDLVAAMRSSWVMFPSR